MNYTNLNISVAKHGLTTLIAAATLSISASVALASNMEKVDIVTEGIDLNPIYVNSNSNGYTGSENKSHKYMVRVFAKAKGQNRVWSVSIYGKEREICSARMWANQRAGLSMARAMKSMPSPAA